MIKCQTCGTDNLESSQYCDECGTRLHTFTAEKINQTSEPRKNPQFGDKPVFQSANVTSIGIPPIAEESSDNKFFDNQKQNDTKNIIATLKIERGDSFGTEFNLVANESYIGRWDADNGVFPDVDLDKHDPEAKVSRRHARIIYEDGKFSIEDLGSTNGTFVNRGRRLIPGNTHLLKKGDEIIVGKTFLRFFIAD